MNENEFTFQSLHGARYVKLGLPMLGRLVNKIRSILLTPVFGTKAIPRDATVPPDQFPEDAYPVTCQKCAYLLRGLPDGKCPECGHPFERGRLLVQQYVTWQGGAIWRQSRAGKWSIGLFGSGMVLNGLTTIAHSLVKGAGGLGLQVLIALMAIAVLMILTSAIVHVATSPRDAKKRHRAVKAVVLELYF